ncbi:MAG TPA: class I SAM-dependent methyltransferase [Thermoanaerobaculia bacterium]|jgi:SAM-dependent methyltransferase|nr:class I SAM-dependent methyltransferase [Thermoanaerobaculia bacterium]
MTVALLALRVIVAVTLMAYVLYQSRKPGRSIGRFFLWAMNRTHSRLTDWGLAHVAVENDFAILDVGCGGGRTIQKLASIAPAGKVCGIDYADGSVAASRSTNKRLIAAGRVQIEKASVSKLPFADNTFDLVSAVETQYYWPDLTNDMREILRVLRPGGTLIVIAESYRGGRYDKLQRPVMKLLKSTNLSVDEHQQLFAAAGYTDIQIFEEPKKGWFCGTARKNLAGLA